MFIGDSIAGSGPVPAVDWAISDRPIEYPFALEVMRRRAAAIRDNRSRELIWLLEHPPLYTGGTGAKDADLLNASALPTYRTGRGGQFTYHGPGQRVVYVMLDLRARGFDIRAFVTQLEAWVVGALAQFNVTGETRRDRVGVWVKRPSATGVVEEKIAAIGLRVSRGVSSHGLSINVDPDLSHYGGIVPCGIRDYGVTSLASLGLPVTYYDVDVALRTNFERAFGATKRVEPPETDTGHAGAGDSLSC
ncbi:lipoate-protein ligase B [Hyphomicrobium denitrificans 1NES1]|uniref:Octanoyltransferase n=1 Tax=Hyphomicrobium denitrificans 1NES1 TaxID=670307 RepID=N0B669_9HYPH|nr:lipoyl(octanoyl) transferase LipB [Hyphomicrobium denitrificans]AGK58493.1 lipoate-protein ligase B [Hyphomicrobium denitrificans 1NES1]